MIPYVLNQVIHGPFCFVLDIKGVEGYFETGYHFVPGFLTVWDGGIIKFVEPSFWEWLSPSFAHLI